MISEVINEMNGKSIDFNLVRVTEDNKYVDTASYVRACNILKKGLLTYKEICFALILETELYLRVSALLLASRQRAKAIKVNPFRYIKEVMKIEQEYCQCILKKDLKAITIEEHLEVMDWLMESTDLINATRGDKKDGRPKTHEQFFNLYLNCRSYITSLN